LAPWKPGIFGDVKGAESVANLKPGLNGTRRLQEKYGAALLCVRYRYDEIRNVMEIIVDEKPLRHPRYIADDMVPVTVGYDEAELRELLRKFRVRWEPLVKLWFVQYGLIRGASLGSRIAAV
jgi:hypothetical protein